MTKKDFNDNAQKQLNDYTLTLSPQCGVMPMRGEKITAERQAEMFRERMTDWLESRHEYENHNVLNTQVMSADADGSPRMRIICTQDALARICVQYAGAISNTEMTAENVSSRRIIKRPGIRK